MFLIFLLCTGYLRLDTAKKKNPSIKFEDLIGFLKEIHALGNIPPHPPVGVDVPKN